MKIEAVRCNKCRIIIDITMKQHMTSCRCGSMFVEVWNPIEPHFKVGGNDITLLYNRDHFHDEDDHDDCPHCD